jgi:hypothetical protein
MQNGDSLMRYTWPICRKWVALRMTSPRLDRVRIVAMALGVLVSASCTAPTGRSQHAAAATIAQPQSLRSSCEAFRPTGLLHGARIDKTEIRPSKEGLPEVCIVRGSIVSSAVSTINWVVELPDPPHWNGKTLTIGGGGFDGFIPTDLPWYQGMVGRSADGYVKMSSDSGHQVRAYYPWALDDVALRNHAFDANHFTLEVGTQIATEFYHRPPTRRYMFGQSNGGRSGLVAMQRYPKDYDGVIALAPAISQQAHQVNVGQTTMRHIFQDPKNWLNPAQIALFAQAEIKACDALDGLEDGIISNVEACKYVPTDLLCTTQDSDKCLGKGQIESSREN